MGKQSVSGRRAVWTALAALAFPAIVEHALQSMVGFIDTLFISRLGVAEAAAAGIANNVLQIYIAVCSAVATAAAVYTSRYSGAGEPETVRRFAAQIVWLACAAGLVLGAAAYGLAEPMLALMGAESDVLAPGTAYFKIVAVPSVLIALTFALGAVLRGARDTKTPMRIGLVVNIVHIALDYALIFGVGFAGLGIAGAACATVCARLIGVALLVRALRKKSLLPGTAAAWKPRPDMLLRLVRLGLPSGAERLAMRLGQIVYFGMIVRMGTDVYAAHTWTGSLTVFPAIVGTGLAAASTTLIGQSLGAGDVALAKKYASASMRLTAGAMTLTTLAIWLASPWAGTAFTQNAVTLSLIVTALAIDTAAQPATGLVASLTATLQAGGDARTPMYATAAGIWIVRTAGVYTLGVRLGLGLAGVWIAIAVDNCIRAAVLYARYRTFRWLKPIG